MFLCKFLFKNIFVVYYGDNKCKIVELNLYKKMLVCDSVKYVFWLLMNDKKIFNESVKELIFYVF